MTQVPGMNIEARWNGKTFVGKVVDVDHQWPSSIYPVPTIMPLPEQDTLMLFMIGFIHGRALSRQLAQFLADESNIYNLIGSAVAEHNMKHEADNLNSRRGSS